MRKPHYCRISSDPYQGVVTSYAYVLPSATGVKMWSRGQGPSDAVVKGSKAFTMDGQMVKHLLKLLNSLTITWWNQRQSILVTRLHIIDCL